MTPFEQFPVHLRKKIRYVLADIDGTLTINGRITGEVLSAMERLQQADISVFAITGRPAGWCDHIARMWPVEGVVGENGAFYFRYDKHLKKMRRRYIKSERQRKKDRVALEEIGRNILQKVPGCRLAADQNYRVSDLAIDFCEDVPPLPMEAVEQIVRFFEDGGAQAKISSIHVNGWFGSHDKLTTTKLLFEEIFGANLDTMKTSVLFIGDSPNDAPMFAFFPHSVGVSDVLRFKGRMTAEPAWITNRGEGKGFAEMVDVLLRSPE